MTTMPLRPASSVGYQVNRLARLFEAALRQNIAASRQCQDRGQDKGSQVTMVPRELRTPNWNHCYSSESGGPAIGMP